MRFMLLAVLAVLCCSMATGEPPHGGPGGVYLLQQGRWSPHLMADFERTPWLDGASVRITWSELEPRDGEYDFSAFDAVLGMVKRWNALHPDRPRTVQLRPMGGEHCPRWMEAAGVRFYDTYVRHSGTPEHHLRIPIPYDNPEFLKQLRQLYRAMVRRYGDEPLVVLYHGTWSAGPWDEIFHPIDDAPMPPGYTKEKFVQGMVQQLDVLIDELCLKAKPAELPFSGIYPPQSRIDITGPVIQRAVQRLGKETDLLFIQSNGWGITNRGIYTVSWGHEPDLNGAAGQVRVAFQAIGTNTKGWIKQGDWLKCIEVASPYRPPYLEIYPPSLTDNENHIEPAMAQYHKLLEQWNSTPKTSTRASTLLPSSPPPQ